MCLLCLMSELFMNKTFYTQLCIVFIFMGIYALSLLSSDQKPNHIFPFEQDPYTCFILEKNPSSHIPYQNAPNSFFDTQQPSINPPPFSYTQPMNTQFDIAKYDASLTNLMYIGQAIKMILAAYAIYTIMFTEKSTANNAYTREHNYLPQHAFDYSHLPLECRKYERYCNIPLRDIVTRPSHEIMDMPEEHLSQQDSFHKNVYLSQQINIANTLAAQKAFRQKSYILHTLLAQSTQGSILSKIRARLDFLQFSHHKDHQKDFNDGVKHMYASWFDKNGNLLPINTQNTQDIYSHFKNFIAHYPLQEEDIHSTSQEHLERYGNIEISHQERGSCKLAQQTETRYNTALRGLIRLADTHASLSEIYAYKALHATILNTHDAQKLYDYIIEQRFANIHTAKPSEYNFSIKNDPLYESNKQDLLLLRKEYADRVLKNFAPLQNIAAQDIFAAIPEQSSELITALQNPNQYAHAIDCVLQNLERNHPECFLNNGILYVFADDSYVAYMHNEYTDPEILHIINYGLLMQHHDASSEGVKQLAKKTVRLARRAHNENHINHTNRTILAHTSYELLKHAKNNDLMLHTMTEQARKIAHQTAFEKEEYMQKFYQQRKEAFEKTEQENYAQYARKHALHQDSVILLCKEDLCPLDFENLNGTNLQHELMAETIEGLDVLGILNKQAQHHGNCRNSFQNTISTLTLFAQAAQEFNSECDINASMHCINTLHSGLEIAIEGARGIGIGLENLGSMIAHPIETGKSLLNFTKSIAWGLQETARYCLFDRTFDEKRARDTESQAQNFLEGVANHIYYSCDESSPGDYARIATEQYTMLKAPGALLDAISSAAHMGKNILRPSITETEIGLFLKKNIINQPYVELASEITQEIKTGISELAQTLIPNINEASAFVVKAAQEVKDLALKFTTQWQTINEILPTLTDANLRPLLKNEEFVNALAEECTHLARLPNAEYLANIKSQYPKLIEIFKQAELPEIIAQHIPHGFTDEQIIPLLDHIFDITTKAGRDKKLISVFGGHANVGGLINESEILQFLTAAEPKIFDGFYNKTIAIKTPLGKFHSYKTYFPNAWSPEQIIEYVIEKLKNAEFALNRNNKLEAFVKIHEKVEIQYIFNPQIKTFDTIFPSFIKNT